MDYHLVFILLWQDVKLPLVQSQTFDQAQVQSQFNGDKKPRSVSVWIFTPFRFLLNEVDQKMIRQLRARCHGVAIRLIPEINRLNNFPSKWFLKLFKRQHENVPTVFHFRGESSFHHFNQQFTKRVSDIFVLDVRGYWPAEFLYMEGIEDESVIPPGQLAAYNQSVNALITALEAADGVITVSKNLESLLRELCSGVGQINVVPCGVSALHDFSSRNSTRLLLGVSENDTLLVYSGGYARYQHLEDLVVPFFRLLLSLDSNIKILILSQDVEKIRELVMKEDADGRFIFKTAPQAEVANYLSACDLGFLLRKESLVNRLAQPVKVGEYLAAGVPVCVEGEVGGVTEKLVTYGAGISIHISTVPKEHWFAQAELVLAFLKRNHAHQAQSLALDYFLWNKNIVKQREYYSSIFER